MLCGGATWTKNEGLVFALALPALMVAVEALRGGRAAAADVAADLVMGLLPFLAALALFKLFLAPEGDIALGLTAAGAWRYCRWVVGGVLLIQVTAFFVVYVMTPHSVAWHVQTSWPRLIVQLWPLVVWAVVLGRGRAVSRG